MGGKSSKSSASSVEEADDLLAKINAEASISEKIRQTGDLDFLTRYLTELAEFFKNLRSVDEKYGINGTYAIDLNPNETYKQVALKTGSYAAKPEYAKEINTLLKKHHESIKELNQEYSPPTKVKRSIDTGYNDLAEQTTDESNEDRIDTDLDDHSMKNDLTNSDVTNNYILLPITAIVASSTIATAFLASNVKSMHHERQGGSGMGTAVRSGVQVAIPTVVGGTSVGVALATGVTAWPITLAIAGAAVFVGTVSAGTTLMVTLYYNKFFVAKKLRSIEDSVKKMPQNELSLTQKKSLIGLIHHSLVLLNGDKEQGIEKSNTKIKKLDSKILFNLIEMQRILSSPAFATIMEESKEVQKLSKNMNKDIDELLEHSVLFSLLINDVKHIKEIYERLKIIKVCEHANTNQPIQNNLAQINLDYLNNKIANYTDLLEQFKKEQLYAASKKGKLRVASTSVLPCIPEKKEFVQLHEEVISLASEINDDYQQIKRLIPHLQEHSNAFKLKTSKDHLFDIYAAYKALSYRNTIEENIASLTPRKETMSQVDDDYIPDGVMDFEKISGLLDVAKR